MLMDTHCHMNIIVRKFDTKELFQPLTVQEIDQLTQIVQDAHDSNVTKIINVGTNLIESMACLQIGELFDNCYSTIGLHPNDADTTWQITLQKFDELLKQKVQHKIVGIGECGIDQHYPDFNLKLQQDVFHAQIQLALKHNVALVIHSRDADQETYEALAAYRGEKNLRGTIHCFSSNEIYAQKYIDLGFVLGIGGTITYPKNETLRNVVRMVPLEKIILETDAPFLPPQKFRGQQNMPAHIYTIAQYISELLSQDFNTIAQTTFTTSQRLFGIN